ncbi:hypothetical protein SLEP1_g27043 [Rubroshorea leprosula]|uniref:Uncharacterized protein n=1 Tax=Rubroshorea leprosula TaxID=152421 RepID=A0AAV5K0G5_9ROSI|nr:hypothetical protein SLEP1_g27043 [Rubroshorea leprosula]
MVFFLFINLHAIFSTLSFKLEQAKVTFLLFRCLFYLLPGNLQGIIVI